MATLFTKNLRGRGGLVEGTKPEALSTTDYTDSTFGLILTIIFVWLLALV